MRRTSLWPATVAVAFAVLVTGCSTSTPVATPGFAHVGPYAVGAATFDLGSAGPALGEQLATVFYPADASKLAGHPLFSYDLEAPLPAALQAIVPSKYNAVITVDAHV